MLEGRAWPPGSPELCTDRELSWPVRACLPAHTQRARGSGSNPPPQRRGLGVGMATRFVSLGFASLRQEMCSVFFGAGAALCCAHVLLLPLARA